MHLGDFLTSVLSRKNRDWISPDDHIVKILFPWISFGVCFSKHSAGICSSKHTILIPLCLLELTTDGVAALMAKGIGLKESGVGKGFGIFPCFLLLIRDKFVFDDEAMRDLYCRNPRKCILIFMALR